MGALEEIKKPNVFFVIGGVVISSVMIFIYIKYGIPFFKNNFELSPLISLGILCGYVIVAYIVNPDPNYGDMGWFDGWMDNPFSLSDDYNRFLLWLKIMLLPGRIVSNSILNLFKFFM